jgi:hypothetical protein
MENNKYWFFGSKLNTALLLVLIILMIIAIRIMLKDKETYFPQISQEQIPTGDTAYEKDNENSYVNIPSPVLPETYTYKNHGFTMQLPKGYIPEEIESEAGPSITIVFPNESYLSYVTNSKFWEEANIPVFTYIKDQKIGSTTFKVYTYSGQTIYWFKQGNVGYQFSGDVKLLETFKFVGWAQ